MSPILGCIIYFVKTKKRDQEDLVYIHIDFCGYATENNKGRTYSIVEKMNTIIVYNILCMFGAL